MKAILRKILTVILFIPIIFYCIHKYPPVYRMRSIWRFFAIPGGVLRMSGADYDRFIDTHNLRKAWLDMKTEEYRLFLDDRYGFDLCYVSFKTETYDRYLLFKSASEKTHFVLKYL